MRILLAGDVMLGRLVNRLLTREPPEYPWGDTLAAFRAADFRVCNLECVLADRGRPWNLFPKAFHFRSDAKNVAVLQAAGIDAVSIANNHVLDYEYDALLEMLVTLDNAGILHAGAGADLAAATRPVSTTADGTRIGLLAFTDDMEEWAAAPNCPGIFFAPADVTHPESAHLVERVREASSEVDLLIVSAHWGSNWGDTPPAEHRALAHALIDAGAGIVFGHSAHVFRGIEVYRERPILYSAGDFVDDYAVDELERNDRSFLFEVECDHGEPRRMQLRPTVIRDFHARFAWGTEALEIGERMRRLCAALGTQAEMDARDGTVTIPLSLPDLLPPAPRARIARSNLASSPSDRV